MRGGSAGGARDREQLRHVRLGEIAVARELRGRRVTAACLLRAAQPRKLAKGAIGEDDRVGDLGDELLHRLAHPPRGVRPEGRAAAGVEARKGAQQAEHAGLDELLGGDRRRAAVAARHGADGRHERGNELIVGAPVTGHGAPNEDGFPLTGQLLRGHCDMELPSPQSVYPA